MLKGIALSAMVAAGLLLLPGSSSTGAAAPLAAERVAKSTTLVEQAQRHVRRTYRPRRHYRPRYYGYRRPHYRRYYARPRVYLYGAPVYSGYRRAHRGCGWMYTRWKRSGSSYWHRRWRACRGW